MFVLLSHINDWTKITKLISLEYLCSVSSFVLTTLSYSLGLHIFFILCFFKPFKGLRAMQLLLACRSVGLLLELKYRQHSFLQPLILLSCLLSLTNTIFYSSLLQVSIVSHILSLASCASDPTLPSFSKDTVADAIKTVVDGFLEMCNALSKCCNSCSICSQS